MPLPSSRAAKRRGDPGGAVWPMALDGFVADAPRHDGRGAVFLFRPLSLLPRRPRAGADPEMLAGGRSGEQGWECPCRRREPRSGAAIQAVRAWPMALDGFVADAPRHDGTGCGFSVRPLSLLPRRPRAGALP